MLHEEVTDKIIKSFYNVYNSLGYGFLEKIYENSMVIELKENGFVVEQQKNIKVFYDHKEVGDYYADLFIQNCVIVELKAAEGICKNHEAQLINYSKATKIEVGLLINFGKKPEFKRKNYHNHIKKK